MIKNEKIHEKYMKSSSLWLSPPLELDLFKGFEKQELNFDQIFILCENQK